MKRYFAIKWLTRCLCGLSCALALANTGFANETPNVVFIMIDDLGWKDLGCYGNDFVETPHIDRLAHDGLRFTDFYAAGAVCSPTRCAVQSGQNQARIGITAHIPGHWRPFERVITPLTTMALPLDTVTVAESLRDAGYATGYIGKWHLGTGRQFQPDRQGYDVSAVIQGPHLPGRYRVLGKTDLSPNPDQYRTDFEADLTIDFIRRYRDRPFFLMLSPFAVHIPLASMSDKLTKYQLKAQAEKQTLPNPIYAAMVEHCDDMVGRIVATLDEFGLSDNTVVVFTSDNGGLYKRYDYREAADDIVATQLPLRGEKGTLYEGGVRVPLIIKYPKGIPRATICREPAISYDFYPTFAELAQADLPVNQTIDGISLVPLFLQPAAELEREALHWHYPHFHHDRPASSIRKRDWKLVEYLDGSDDIELYNLKDDLGEQVNLAMEDAQRTLALKDELASWRNEVLARMPIPNPGYDPSRAAEWWSMRTGQPIKSNLRRRFPPSEQAVENR